MILAAQNYPPAKFVNLAISVNALDGEVGSSAGFKRSTSGAVAPY
jgi:hypothetical protein